MISRRLGRLLLYVALVSGAVVFTIPLLWMLSTAVKPIDQARSSPPRWLPYQHLMQVDGQAVPVGVEDMPEDAAAVSAQTPITVGVAYQWVMEIDGQAVPVKPVDEQFDEGEAAMAEVVVHYHMQVNDGGGWRLAKLAELSQGAALEGQVDIVVIEDDGYMSRETVKAERLRRSYDLTARDMKASFGVSETLAVPVEALSRVWVPWDDRSVLAHVLTDWRDAEYGDLTEKIAFRWRNFSDAVQAMDMFPAYLKNTLVLCVLTVIGTVISSTLVAYGFSRIEWPGRDKVFLLVMATMMIPGSVMMVPLFTLFRDMGWIGTLRPLWVPTFFAGAFNVFLLRQFFRTIPKDLSEAAKIDGCSELRVFWQIILPLAKPAITVVALFQFMGTWNDFLGPLIYLTDQEDFTLALGLQFFQSKSGGTQWHYLMAASSLVVLPVIVLFFLAQRTFIEGISMSGLKG